MFYNVNFLLFNFIRKIIHRNDVFSSFVFNYRFLALSVRTDIIKGLRVDPERVHEGVYLLLFFRGWNVLVIYCWAVLLYL
jgi:hypothetical protein